MSCLGVHFALSEPEAAHLRSLADEDTRLEHVHEVIEEKYFGDEPELKAESDKAWDAMHRALTDGRLAYDAGEYPLGHAVLAGELLYTRPDYIVSLKTPRQVRDVAVALAPITEQDFRERYFMIDVISYGLPLSEEDFGYTWDRFQAVRDLYARAAEQGRYMLFTVDQ